MPQEPEASEPEALLRGLQLLMIISGYTVCRNCIDLDYCLEETVRSMLAVCDDVVVIDLESTDGTIDLVRKLESEDNRVRLVHRPWTNPHNEPRWLTKIVNVARENDIKGDWQLWISADEVIDPGCGPVLRSATTPLFLQRLNFWQDANHLVPHGAVCGGEVARFAPSRMMMVDDDPYPEGSPEILRTARRSDIQLFHYGFLRKNEAFFAKSRVCHKAFLGTYDERLERAEKEGKHWSHYAPFEKPLLPFQGQHPAHQ